LDIDSSLKNVLQTPPRTDDLALIDVGSLVKSIRKKGPELIVPVS
jgi:putative SOS response-associated peptidase YedK